MQSVAVAVDVDLLKQRRRVGLKFLVIGARFLRHTLQHALSNEEIVNHIERPSGCRFLRT